MVASVWAGLWMLAAGRYDGHRIVRVDPTSPQQLQTVLDLADDVWTERIGPGPVDVRVGPAAYAELEATGIAHEVRVADAQAAVDAERARLTTAPSGAPQWFDDFKDLAAIEAYVDLLADTYPHWVEVENIGTSLEGRPIRAMRIGGVADDKNAVLLTGTMHAREWLSTMTVMCIADALASGYDVDPAITEVLDRTDVLVVPMVNPDGYVLTWNGERYWRKNTRDGYGVDLNRNFSVAWGGPGASANPGDENYHGTAAFSEPETQVVRDYVVAHPELVAHIDYHSFAQLVIYPWGYTYDAAPDDGALAALAGDLAGDISASGIGYTPIQGADFYPAAGVVDDWSYGERGIMAFTVEVRGDDFVVPPSQIVPTCEENLAGALTIAQWAADQSSAVPPEPDPTSGTGGGDDGAATGGDDGATTLDPMSGTGAGDGVDPDDGDPTAAGTGAGLDDALPSDYGSGTTGGCACGSDPDPAPPGPSWWAWSLLMIAVGRRRN